MLIGITGGIGGGKSTVSDLIRKKGYSVYNTDLEARRLQDESEELKQQIVQLLGTESYDVAGNLNRPYVASIVFHNASKLAALNAIVHPAVRKDLAQWKLEHEHEKLLFLECAILFEGGFDKVVDKIIVVTAPEEIRIARAMNRDHVTREQVVARINHQYAEQEKIQRADFIINTFPDDQVPADVDSLLKTLIKE